MENSGCLDVVCSGKVHVHVSQALPPLLLISSLAGHWMNVDSHIPQNL